MTEKQKRRRACAVCVNGDRLLVVWLEDPHSKKIYPFPPGGKIEKDESPWEAAERECFEETGYLVKADPRSELCLHYDFPWNGVTVACETYFFRAKLLTPSPEPRAEAEPYLIKTEWVAIADLTNLLGFHETILRAVQTLA